MALELRSLLLGGVWREGVRFALMPPLLTRAQYDQAGAIVTSKDDSFANPLYDHCLIVAGDDFDSASGAMHSDPGLDLGIDFGDGDTPYADVMDDTACECAPCGVGWRRSGRRCVGLWRSQRTTPFVPTQTWRLWTLCDPWRTPTVDVYRGPGGTCTIRAPCTMG